MKRTSSHSLHSRSTFNKPNKATINELNNIAIRLRCSSIRQTTRSKSGHPTTCCSAADIVAMLFNYEMRYNVNKPLAAGNDRLILSKGHAAPLLYAAWQEVGYLKEDPIKNLRLITSDLEGHPTPRLPFVDCATGSLGQGLAIAAGMAWAGKFLDKSDYRTYCLLGDGECAEGSNWEACNFAGHYKLNNLCGIVDLNRLGQSEATNLGHDVETVAARFTAFGWRSIIVNGHSMEDLAKAFHTARTETEKPTMIVAKTFKGFGMGDKISDQDNWHGKPMSQEICDEICANLENKLVDSSLRLIPQAPSKHATDLDDIQFGKVPVKLSSPPNYKPTDKIATRKAYGTALAKIGQDNARVVAADGDTKNSTFALDFKNVFPDRFIECFIAEQLIAGIVMGVSCRNRAVTFGSTFAAFWSRAFDQIRMGAISQTNANFCGSHAGCSIGEDGPSQMALEDLAMFRSVANSTVFYPSDPVAAENAVMHAANTQGICFIRTSRPGTACVYKNEEQFQVGQHKVIYEGSDCMIIGAGVTLHEAIKAREMLDGKKSCKIIDLFTIKPVNAEWLAQEAEKCGNNVIVVEDHYPEGGVGSAVSDAFRSVNHNINFRHLCVRSIPRSGPPAALMAMFGIDAESIVQAVYSL